MEATPGKPLLDSVMPYRTRQTDNKHKRQKHLQTFRQTNSKLANFKINSIE